MEAKQEQPFVRELGEGSKYCCGFALCHLAASSLCHQDNFHETQKQCNAAPPHPSPRQTLLKAVSATPAPSPTSKPTSAPTVAPKAFHWFTWANIGLINGSQEYMMRAARWRPPFFETNYCFPSNHGKQETEEWEGGFHDFWTEGQNSQTKHKHALFVTGREGEVQTLTIGGKIKATSLIIL